MDQPLKYEQLIGEKLLNISVPNMQDMIWARIKMQLDIDLPTDDSDGGDDGPQAPSGVGPLRWGLSVLLVAFVGVFFLFKNQKTPQNNTKQQPVITTPAIQPSNQSNDPPGQQNDIKKQAPIVAPASLPITGNQALADSVITDDLSSLPAGSPDSLQTGQVNADVNGQATPLITNTDTPIVKKKRRGVTGIKDDDYRIVPKKKDR